jgi:hypothetical protein
LHFFPADYSLFTEGTMLAKWGAPGVIFAGWMVWPCLGFSDGSAPEDPGTFKFSKEGVGEVPSSA